MEKPFEDLKFPTPEQFQKSTRRLLMTCGTRVIDGVVKGILDETNPGGGAQKRNAESTIKRKGHDHPLIGGSAQSPLLAKQSTYRKDYNASGRYVEVRLKPVRADVGVYVERKGYWFFSVTPWAVTQMDKLVRQYCKNWAHWLTNPVAIDTGAASGE